ncbi:ABC transporter ATP-binding protein [Algoriphagus sp. Y33]|uniref:ABC transporter ATP-binding protein n=1 Tax=Algoriphagus sp. Y33 TaxID=2772483 RepID=UPI001781F19E|nr:ABC transporter ATP-binding protein [Algoriphagus sp. Y33]
MFKRYFSNFSYFYSHLRYRVFISLGLSLAVGVLDGFGLAMFIPLLQMIDNSSSPSSENIGGMKFLVDGLEQVGLGLTLQTVLFSIMFFFILKGLFKFCQGYYNVITQQLFIKKLRTDYVKKLGNFRFESFVNIDSGMVQNTLGGEVGRVSTAFKTYFSTIQAGIMVFVYLALAMITNFQFALLVAVGGGLSNLLYNRIYKRTKETSKKITKGGHAYQGLIIQKVAFFKYLKATGLMDKFFEKIKSSIDYIENSNKKIGFYNSLVVAAREPMVITVVVLTILIQVKVFSESIGAIILSLLFFYRSLNSLVELQNQWNNFLNVTGSLHNMIEFGRILNNSQDTDGDEKFSTLNDSIEFQQVSFSYGDKAVLKDIDLKIKSKTTIALIGESGSGKTTLVNLIAGLFKPEKGSILLDNTELNKLQKQSYQSRIGYITQDPVIFSDSIFNNITQWAPKTEENIQKFWDVLKKASIDNFVLELPNREDSLLGNNGIQVSGGQKQRLSIARELYKNIEILIMDEATSSLDSETERIIQDNIDSLKGQYTIVIVAHRLSTIKAADQIFLLDKGEIVASGDFKTLVEKSDQVRKIVELQEV